MGHLVPLRVKHHGCDKPMHAPVEPDEALHRLPVRKWCFGHLDDEVKHRNPAPICSHVFSQSWSQAPTLFEAILHDRWQGEKRWSLAPLPDACFIGKAKEKLGGSSL